MQTHPTHTPTKPNKHNTSTGVSQSRYATSYNSTHSPQPH